jgi:RND superfamily putative drug exporter
MLRPYGPRPAVRELILNDVDEHPPGGLVQPR